jgi:hypothetical protein
MGCEVHHHDSQFQRFNASGRTLRSDGSDMRWNAVCEPIDKRIVLCGAKFIRSYGLFVCTLLEYSRVFQVLFRRRRCAILSWLPPKRCNRAGYLAIHGAFYVSGQVNNIATIGKLKILIWLHQRTLHPRRVIAWCANWASGIIGC